MTTHERFEAWKQAHHLALELYRVTDGWPRDERFGLTAQLRRAAVSIPANIAEGVAKHGTRELRRFLDIALGSLSELSYFLLFARERGLLQPTQWETLEAQREQVGKLTWGLATAVGRKAGRRDGGAD
jgi:four helix bundle protein